MREEDCLGLFAKTQTRSGGGKQVIELIVYLRDSPQPACSIMEDGG